MAGVPIVMGFAALLVDLHSTKGDLNVTGSSSAQVRQTRVQSVTAPNLAYVGSYSSPQGPEGNAGHGQGTYLFQLNPSTGALSQREIFSNESNPFDAHRDRP